MTDNESSRKLTWIVWLLALNFLVLAVASVALLFGLLPKIERAVGTAERVEARFQSFADDVQPVLSTSAGKAIETIKKMDSDKLSETATKKTDSLMNAAAARAKRLLNRDGKADEE